MSTSERAYHHGHLRSALVTNAMELLESGGPYSMRAVARRTGVSPTAPYRHFPDREALDSAIAVEGFTDLHAALARTLEASSDTADAVAVLAGLAVAYVDFALRRPAVFRLMFGNECDEADSERIRASRPLHAMLDDVLAHLFPGHGSSELASALWSLAHGLAFLHLDGKFRPEPPEEVAARVRMCVAAILAV